MTNARSPAPRNQRTRTGGRTSIVIHLELGLNSNFASRKSRCCRLAMNPTRRGETWHAYSDRRITVHRCNRWRRRTASIGCIGTDGGADSVRSAASHRTSGAVRDAERSLPAVVRRHSNRRYQLPRRRRTTQRGSVHRVDQGRTCVIHGSCPVTQAGERQ